MSLSSDSEPLPRLKVRRVTRKVSFSHPLAYQDPQFILKRQVHESRRHTRTNKDTDLSAGLPDATRKRRTEVFSHLYPFHPLAGVIRQPLNSSDSNYQETSPSFGRLYAVESSDFQDRARVMTTISYYICLYLLFLCLTFLSFQRPGKAHQKSEEDQVSRSARLT